ncbi:hypothetical protein ABZ678_14090 [Streptomyces hirsutus]|uniref:hypothetical protein n=1 Tax=Streptomyces hirsutus TaxID=35620 RepID=UPI003400301D
MNLEVQEDGRNKSHTYGTIWAGEAELFAFRNFGYPDNELEIGMISPEAMQVHFGDIISAFTKKIPDLNLTVGDPVEWPEFSTWRESPTMSLTLGFNEEDIWFTFDWINGQPPTVTFSIPFAQAVPESEVRQRSERILLRHGMKLLSMEEYDEYKFHTWSIQATCIKDQRLSDAKDCAQLLTTAAHSIVWPDELSRAETLRLIRLGQVETLLGWLTENEWFDAKESVVLDARGTVEFAKDLAQFANGSAGGLLLIGAKTSKDEGGVETLSKLCPLDKNPKSPQPVARLAQSLRDIATSHIYPLPEGLQIEVVDTSKGQVICAHTPKQAKNVKPFIVTGEAVFGKIKNTFFSIPVRTHDGNAPVSSREIYALLAGRMIRLQDRDAGKEG